jgi:hypothetical protein
MGPLDKLISLDVQILFPKPSKLDVAGVKKSDFDDAKADPTSPSDRQGYFERHYRKSEHQVPMRDGVRLFTQVYSPIDESEVLTPADPFYHVDKKRFTVPFVCGARDLGEALRRIAEGAAIPESEITYGDRVVKLDKKGRGVIASYEVIRRMSVEMLRVHLQRIGDACGATSMRGWRACW